MTSTDKCRFSTHLPLLSRFNTLGNVVARKNSSVFVRKTKVNRDTAKKLSFWKRQNTSVFRNANSPMMAPISASFANLASFTKNNVVIHLSTNKKPQESFKSQPSFAFAKAKAQRKILVKKRLSTIFSDYQLIIIWANIQPIAEEVLKKLKLINFGLANGVDILDLTKRANESTAFPLYLPVASGKFEIESVKFGKLPKETFNTHCLNIHLPNIKGCGVDFFAVRTKVEKIEPLANAKQLTKKRANFPETAPGIYYTDDYNSPKLQNSSIKSKKTPEHKLILSWEQSLKTHQIAEILDMLQLNAFIVPSNPEKMIPHNQLLGAFTSGLKSPLTFVSAYEIRQSLILQQKLKLKNYSAAKAPFCKMLSKIKAINFKLGFQINATLTRLIRIINHPTKKLNSLTPALIASKKT